MLQEICPGVVVDRQTELVQMTPYDWKSTEGCRCLRALIESKRTVHIHPLPSPAAEVPGSNGPGKPKKTIGSCCGGATVPVSFADASH